MQTEIISFKCTCHLCWSRLGLRVRWSNRHTCNYIFTVYIVALVSFVLMGRDLEGLGGPYIRPPNISRSSVTECVWK